MHAAMQIYSDCKSDKCRIRSEWPCLNIFHSLHLHPFLGLTNAFSHKLIQLHLTGKQFNTYVHVITIIIYKLLLPNI